MDASKRAKLPQVARASVRAADKSGALDRNEYTMAVARADVLKRLNLTEVDSEGKKIIKEAVMKALAALGENEEQSSNEEVSEEQLEDNEEVEEEPPRKGRRRETKLKAPSESEDSKSDSFDPFDDDEEPPRKRARSSKVASRGASASTGRSRTSTPLKQGKPSAKSVEVIEDSDDEAAPAKRKLSTSPSPASSMSSTPHTRAPVPLRVATSRSQQLSPDEAQIADLKRIVVACGVRKQWTKEFADCPTPSSQINHLKSILHSLGMKGKPTMGKAKSLKERRELAQELNDVKEFEASRGAERPRRGHAEPDRRVSASGAMAAVMDFLDDDDDDDDDK
ncbi:hypothetical protein CC85DRAFT_285208 [Cutaneotrichosporon oleaginosum]|uniref:Uncharacterized protein n=1 Tax=Cutaneotrichosporon oleaginosum TaxID=879819 RepID=A0A0J0XNY0_9TREE|nr:uncharacterized protein CC85DRAFT_285208 [Cutaneotrichosporon oleaginosum]KLT42861.1 hypothetical protein CC85DRAFT_285208 [Cutaneotrichosporon oleaginosum]TXT08174.1 hypothetical protein COLE_05098 [Cutaneotrichosporon oleaginosum]